MAPFRLARPRNLVYFALEGGLIFAVLYGLALVTSLALQQHKDELALLVVPAGILFTALLLLTQWGNPTDKSSLVREIVIFSLVSVVTGMVACAAILLFLPKNLLFSALLLLEGAIAVPLVVAGWRWASIHYHVLNPTREKVLIVGTGETARQVCRWISAHHTPEYGIVGFADETDGRSGMVLAMGVRIQTHYEALTEFAQSRVDRVIVALDEKRGKLPVRQLMELRLGGLEVEEATSFLERVSGKIAVETMLPSWLIFSEGFKQSPLRRLLKRLTDLSHSTGLLIISSPLMLLTAILIKLDSRGPIFYRQRRLGRNGLEFNVLKFRSMHPDAELQGGPQWAEENDPRVTRVGRVIRQLRIDELPQLLNVLRGEMSFVGPRPERGHFAQRLEKKIPYYRLRLTARPGVTGWAQVEYRYGSTDEDALEKLKYDLYYIKNGNLLFDLWIVIKTIKVVLLGTGAR